MIKDIYEARVVTLNSIRDLLFEMSEAEADSIDTQLLRDYFGKLADHIIESIGLEIVSVDSGVVIAKLYLPNADK